MKKFVEWARSVLICLLMVLVMVGAGYYQLPAENDVLLAGSIVEAALGEQIVKSDDDEEGKGKNPAEEIFTAGENGSAESKALSFANPLDEPADQRDWMPPQVESNSAREAAKPEAEKSTEPLVARSTAKEPVDNSEQKEAGQEKNEQPAAVPAPVVVEAAAEAEVEEAPRQVTVSPVTYSWGSSGRYTFRIEVNVTNNGSDTSRNVSVTVPLLENRSPYQTTSLKSVNYSATSNSGRMSTFNLGDIAPGETKTIRADFDITVRAVSINSTNETVEKARQAYNQYAGNGNCRTLARGFISKAREMGIEAREVIGFARPQRGAMTSGSLQGTRHSWAEFYVDGLGWVPVDLTFKYFGAFPHTSHVIESYSDQSIKVNFTGGSLSASWSNSIL